jgi:hypothetical protein
VVLANGGTTKKAMGADKEKTIYSIFREENDE